MFQRASSLVLAPRTPGKHVVEEIGILFGAL